MEDRLIKLTHIIDAGSFSAAAERLHISQPALTVAIQKLERELKTILIDREAKQLKLTPSGRLAYRAGRRLRLERQRLQTSLGELAGQRPTLRLGAIDDIAELLFIYNDELTALQANYNVSLVVNNSAHLLAAVADEELDLALVVAQPTDDYPAGLETRHVGNETLVCVAAPALETLVRHKLGQGLLLNFISYNQGSTTYRLIQTQLDRDKIVAQPLFFSTSPHLMLNFALNGKGVAILPLSTVLPYLAQDELVIIPLRTGVIRRPIIAASTIQEQLHSQVVRDTALSLSRRPLLA